MTPSTGSTPFAKSGAIGAHELTLLLEAPAAASSASPWVWQETHFSDPLLEAAFLHVSDCEYVERLPALAFLGLIAMLSLITLHFTLPGGITSLLDRITMIYIAVLFTSMLIVMGLALVTYTRFSSMYLHPRRCRLIIEITALISCPIAIISMHTVPASTFVSLMYLFATVVILRPSRFFVFANLLAASTAYAYAISVFVSSDAVPALKIINSAVLLSIIVVLSGIRWVAANIDDCRAFHAQRTLDHTWHATQRVLTAALPRHIIPTLIQHIGEHRDWGNDSATAEPDVTIIFVRFPPLSDSDVFPEAAVDAVAQLNSLWTLCDATMLLYSVTTLEITNTEYVGVVGLGSKNPEMRPSDAVAGVRASLAILAALPRAFAAVAVVGVHSGPVVAGFVGTLRPRFTLVGDTMNSASRMASAAHRGGITVSANTHSRIAGLFDSERRTTNIKGKGDSVVYDILREKAIPQPLTQRGSRANSTGSGDRFSRRSSFRDFFPNPPSLHDILTLHSPLHKIVGIDSRSSTDTVSSLDLKSMPAPVGISTTTASGYATPNEVSTKPRLASPPTTPRLTALDAVVSAAALSISIASDEPNTLSARFKHQNFTFLSGFTNATTEAQYRAQPSSPHNSQLTASVVTIALIVIMTNCGDEYVWIDRFVTNAITLAVAVGVTLASYLYPLSKKVISQTTYMYMFSMLISPLFGHQLWSIILSSVVFMFCPVSHLTVLRRTSLKLVHVTIISILMGTGYYDSGNINKQNAAPVSSLFWLWLLLLLAIADNLTVDRLERTRFAQTEALSQAQAAGAAVLTHLLPRSIFERLAAGNSLAAMTTENEDVAVLCADIVGFTAMSASAASPAIIFDVVNGAFREFERVAHTEGAFKVKTLGDCIIFAAGLRDFPGPAAGRVARVALLTRVARAMHTAANHLSLKIRIGIHVGSLVSGVMNSRGFVYDVWGDGILHAMAAEAAAPVGGIAFTAEAAAVLDDELALLLRRTSVAQPKSSRLLIAEAAEAVMAAEVSFLEGMSVITAVEASSLVPKKKRLERPSIVVFMTLVEDIIVNHTLNGRSHRSIPIAGAGVASHHVSCSKSSRTRAHSACSADSDNSSNEVIFIGSGTWSWDVFAYADEAGLPAVAFSLLRPSLVCCGEVTETAARAITAALCASYSHLPFHNAYHGISTMQVVILLANKMPAAVTALSNFDILLLAIAALGHDAGHVGFNNAFEVARRSPIALNHGGDGPVLERFHAANTIALIDESGLFAQLTTSTRAAALHTITAAIMATDMSRHIAIVEDLVRCDTLSSLALDALSGALVHCADLSAHAFPLAISLAWTARISDEFSNQVAEEERLGLPITTFMTGLDKPLARARMQATFASRVVAPLWRALADHAEGSLDEPIGNIYKNSDFYAQEVERLNPENQTVFAKLTKSRRSIERPTSPASATPALAFTGSAPGYSGRHVHVSGRDLRHDVSAAMPIANAADASANASLPSESVRPRSNTNPIPIRWSMRRRTLSTEEPLSSPGFPPAFVINSPPSSSSLDDK